MTPSLPRTGVWFFPDRPAPELVSLIQEAEDLGLDEVWLGDEGPAREPFAVLAAASQKTSRIRLGVGITNPYVRHPALAVTTMLTINELSGGRAMLGVGAGGTMSLDPFGLTADAPVSTMRHFLELATAVRNGDACPGYQPADVSIDARDYGLPIYVGARGPRLNTVASEHADGAFIAGMPPYRFPAAIGWARSVHPIDVALYPSVAFGPTEQEHHRPEMIWSLLDAPDEVRSRFGLERAEVATAADALRQGDSRLARALVTPEMQGELMLVGQPRAVGAKLAAMVRELQPTSIGLALIQDDLVAGLNDSADAFAATHQLLEER